MPDSDPIFGSGAWDDGSRDRDSMSVQPVHGRLYENETSRCLGYSNGADMIAETWTQADLAAAQWCCGHPLAAHRFSGRWQFASGSGAVLVQFWPPIRLECPQ